MGIENSKSKLVEVISKKLVVIKIILKSSAKKENNSGALIKPIL